MKESRAGVWGLRRTVRALTSLGLAILMWQGYPGTSLKAAEPNTALKEVIEGPQRSAANIARDPYRHPLEVLTFFGVEPQSDVVEIAPAKAGYWIEILAPYLKDHGRYTVSGDATRDIAPLNARIAISPEIYGKIVITEFAGGDQEIAPQAAPISCSHSETFTIGCALAPPTRHSVRSTGP